MAELPLRDELLALYRRAEDTEKPQPEPDGNKLQNYTEDLKCFCLRWAFFGPAVGDFV
ncbi:39553_t:CDS:2 [Gigaspora margarita]|uniref:39553_t:CDS:1 n=1 Tax=Gigaspora margarita TaxID=4874 RepID=A0ABN7V0J2_GIGMA|nr:39553_t:CDS:2 [Gigaspora margarita]